MFRQKQVFAVLFGLLFCLAAAHPNVSVVSFGVPPDVYAQGNSPTVTIEFGPSASVPVGTAIEVTMRFHDLTFFAQDNETRLIFRADVVGADQCEDNADGLGVERYMWKVDENPEVRTGTVLASCPAGDYTIAASVTTSDNTELASASASFTIAAPVSEQTATPTSTPAPTVTITPTFTPTRNSRAISAIVVASNPWGTSPATVSWNPPADTPDDYQVNWARADESYPTGADNNAYPTDTSYTITGLENVRHKVRVRARYNSSFGPWIEVEEFGGPGPTSTPTPTATPTATPTPTTTPTATATPPIADSPEESPSVTIEFGPSASVPVGTAIEVTMRFHDLTFFAQDNETRLIFRADVVGADQCKDNADGLGVERYMWKVDENPEVRTGTVLASCPAGNYTIEASVSTSDNTELASASASFTIAAPASQPTATPTSTPAPTATPTPTTTPTATATPPIADSPEESPSVTIEFGPSASVPVGTAIEVTMRFHDLTFFAQDNETRLIFRADVVGADQCKDNADGLGVERYMWKVDENPEVRTGTVLASCPAGDYTIAASVTTSDNTELASASASFTIAAPVSEQTATPTSTPAPTVTITPTFTPTRNSRAISAIVVASNPWGTSPATVSWNPPADTPDDYQVNWARADESYPTGADNNAYPTDTSYTITGLENVRHKVRVRARYNSSFGPWIEVEEFGGPGPTSTPTPTATASLIPTATVTLTATATATTEVTDGNASDDKAVLVAFYNDTGGSDWTNNSNWLSDKPLSSWAGVTTDSNGRVTQLNLSSNNLRGSLSSELGQLTSLRRLNLMENRLRGSIPSELGSLSLLENLNLARNYGLNGPLPSELGSLSNLEVLRLDENTFTGTIPPELGNLSNLERLNLHSNNLTGTIPSELGNLLSLERLNLSWNSLTGSTPSELGNLSNLVGLYLHSNNLTGTIPSELGNLSNLVGLYLFSNNLTGTIPSELGNLSNLEYLWLESNNLSGAIPSELGNLSNLEYLYLQNHNLSGAIPSELGNLSNLIQLNLSYNNLTGSIPPQLGNLVDLNFLDLAFNDLTGAVPSELGNLINLQWLYLYGNQLSGCVPSVWREVPNKDQVTPWFRFCQPVAATPTPTATATATPTPTPTATPTATPTSTPPRPAPSNPPGVPDTPSGEVTAPGRVALDWNDVAEAASYQVRVWIGAKWIELPGNGYNIVVEGSSAQISNLPTEGFYYFSVRAVNAAGSSEWSGFNSMNSQHR